MTIAQRPLQRVSPALWVTLPAAGLVVGVTIFAWLEGQPKEEEPSASEAPVQDPMPEPPAWTENVPAAHPDFDDGCQVSVRATYEGRPVNDVQLSLYLVGADHTDSTWTAVPRDDGVHRFVGLPKGTYHLVALRDDTPPQAAQVWSCEGDGERAFFELALPTGGSVLTGRVTGRDDQWAEGTEVLLEQPDGHRGAFPGIVHLPVDEEGRFEVKLLPGRYTLLALAPHHTPRAQQLTLDEDGGATRIRLAWRPEARGVVYDADGEPVAGADVFLGPHFDPKVPASVVRSRDDGSFVLPILPGREVLVAARTDAGFGMARLAEVSALEGHTGVVVQLAKGRTVTGWIEHRDARPCAFCDVSYRVKSHGLVGVVKSAEDGTFSLPGMPMTADVELWPKDGAIGAWGGQVATPERSRVLLTYVAPAY